MDEDLTLHEENDFEFTSELSEFIFTHPYTTGEANSNALADDIIARFHTKSKMVHSAEELDDLRYGATILDSSLLVATKPWNKENIWKVPGMTEIFRATDFDFPVRVLHEFPVS